MTKSRSLSLKEQASKIRRNIVEMLVPTESHHIGCSLGIVEILAVLYCRIMKVNPGNPQDPSRDVFILSKGHGAAALYATLHQKGFFGKDLLMTYDQNGGIMPEHASTSVPGVEVSTGSLGHGLPIGCGFSLSFQNDQKPNKVYVLMSDGELNEGSNWEAIMFAGHHKLHNLIAIVDLNGFQGYAETSKVLDLSPLSDKFQAFNWNVYSVDGNDTEELRKVFEKVNKSQESKPNCIIAKTIKGKGITHFEGKFESHYKSVNDETKKIILKQLHDEL